MNLVELPSRDEHDFFLALCQRNTHQMIGDNYAIGGSSAGTGRFYWMTTRQSVNYPLRFSPGEPNNLNNNEVYLNVFKSPGGFVFNDVGIGSILNFICQSIQYTRKPLTTTTRRTTTTILPPIVPTELPNWPKCDPGSVEK